MSEIQVTAYVRERKEIYLSSNTIVKEALTLIRNKYDLSEDNHIKKGQLFHTRTHMDGRVVKLREATETDMQVLIAIQVLTVLT